MDKSSHKTKSEVLEIGGPSVRIKSNAPVTKHDSVNASSMRTKMVSGFEVAVLFVRVVVIGVLSFSAAANELW